MNVHGASERGVASGWLLADTEYTFFWDFPMIFFLTYFINIYSVCIGRCGRRAQRHARTHIHKYKLGADTSPTLIPSHCDAHRTSSLCTATVKLLLHS